MEKHQRKPGWPERRDRRQVCVTAVAYLPDGTPIAVRLTDISYEGCQVESDEMLPIGEKLKLALPRLGDVSAQVRWALPGKAGMRFLLDEPLADERRSRLAK